MTSIKFTSSKIVKAAQQGFTLIELLIVIAVLGVLAAVVLVAINPTEQLARGRDASRLQEVAQLGGALQAYATAINGGAPMTNAVAATGFQTALVASQDIENVITAPAASVVTYYLACTPNVQGGFCYGINGATFVVWTAAESALYNSKGPCAAAQHPYFVYSSAQGRSGTACLAGAATVPAANVTLN